MAGPGGAGPTRPSKPFEQATEVLGQALVTFVRWLFDLVGLAILFYLIVHADIFGTPREQLAWAVVGVAYLAFAGYRGLRKRLDGILHELREIRTPSEGKN